MPKVRVWVTLHNYQRLPSDDQIQFPRCPPPSSSGTLLDRLETQCRDLPGWRRFCSLTCL